MYFGSRAEAGQILAQQLFDTYRREQCVVLALGDGSVLVGEQIATALHCMLTMLVMEDIEVPGEDLSFGGVSQSGSFTYNSSFTQGEIDEYVSEFHGYLEDQKREKSHKINQLIAGGEVLDRDSLRNRIIILVADGVDDDASIDVALDFLKPIRIRKLVMATPLATVPAVDKLHLAADELHILDVKENFMGVNHYYEDNTIPSHEETIAKIKRNINDWV